MAGNYVKVVPFHPAGDTVNLAVSTSTGNVQIISDTIPIFHSVRIYNSGSVTVFVSFGDTNSITALTTTGMPIPAGNTEVFGISEGYIAAISASGSGTIYITPGDGT
jgi:hypothetical protein